uniref:Reverse transcriptase domain-containing protein n=2 Tax=Aegilops tauschii subsp. strangulata TaxID=200361 RepID=A0A453EYF3_AEGTS
MICGDFNLILRSEDKNTDNLNRRMMGKFRRLVNDLALKEVYLNGRRYTWSNEQSLPTLVHLDRVLCTSDWEDGHGECHLTCLASVVSDHSPLLLDCAPAPVLHRRFHFEDHWLRLDGFHETVAAAWGSVHEPDPFRRLMLRLQATARCLTSWSAKAVGNVKTKLAIARELIARFDKAQEDRILTPPEDWLRKQMKISYLGLASLEQTIARQRARIASLKDGDASTAFFHRQCSFRRQKNRIFRLSVNGLLLTDHNEMAEAAFRHFDALLGTAVERDHTLDLSQLIDGSDLSDLDAAFCPEEIWKAVKRLPAHKAPGPDGFNAEFLHACWSIVKQDFMDVFQQLFEMCGRGFCKLNQALLTLLPKRADALELRDYRPICLIHIVAKVFAKALSLRLAPKLDHLVSRNQNAFILGRSLHDNFMLVRQSLKLLSQLGAPGSCSSLTSRAHSTPYPGHSSSRSCANMGSVIASSSGLPSSCPRRAPGSC